MSSTNFSFDTIQDFDDHIAKSIPNYHLLNDAVKDLATFFVKEDFSIVDLGCSTGSLIESIPFDGKKLGIDISANLLPDSHDDTEYLRKDLRSLVSFGSTPSLVISLFTLQFLPLADRPNILSLIYDELAEGGAFIWAEKVHEEQGELERIMNFGYYDFKGKHFSPAEIMQKEKDLRPLMTTNTSARNMIMAENAGFTVGTMFWKFYNFEAWVFIK
jgi:tRNA (cmo5U34)-methyltransferase